MANERLEHDSGSGDNESSTDSEVDANSNDVGTPEESEEDTQIADELGDGWVVHEQNSIYYLTLRSSGILYLFEQTVKEYFNDAEYAKVLFNPNERKLALKPMEDEKGQDDKVHEINNKSEENGLIINLKDLRKIHGLEEECGRRYIGEWNDDMEVLMIDLTEPDREISQENG